MPVEVSRYNGNLVVRTRPSLTFRVFGVVVAVGFIGVVLTRPWPDVSLWLQVFHVAFLALVTLLGVAAVFEPHTTTLAIPADRNVVIGRTWLRSLSCDTVPFDQVRRVELTLVPLNDDGRLNTLRLRLRDGTERFVASAGGAETSILEGAARDLSVMVGVPLSVESAKA